MIKRALYPNEAEYKPVLLFSYFSLDNHTENTLPISFCLRVEARENHTILGISLLIVSLLLSLQLFLHTKTTTSTLTVLLLQLYR